MIKKEESAPKYGIADVSMAGRKLWLVKVPQRMAELFDGAAPGTEIAQLTVTPGEKGNVVEVKVPTNKGTSTYTLNPSTIATPLAVFSETAADRLIRFEGTIQSKFDMVPNLNDQTYRKSLVESQRKREIKKPVQINFDDDGVIEPTIFVNDTVKRSTIDENRRVADKRERLEKDEVLRRIFAKFHESEYLTFKELNEYCQQPDAYLKQVLNEVAVYHSSGKTKNHWSLKSDFKTFEAKKKDIDPSKMQGKGGWGAVKEKGEYDDDDADRMDTDVGGGGGDEGYDMGD